MTKLSRRHLVAGGLAGAGASVMPGFIKEANAAVMVRHNLTSAPGQAMLKKYAQAVKMMMALPASNPLSWTFQWYTHAVPTNTTKAAAITATFGAPPSPQKALAQSMWDTCQAHFNSANEPFFLPWHRMYVCYFENIVRKILGDPSFTLPYWNYTVPAGYRLPPEFRMQNDPTFGSLFRPNRKVVVNAGQPIFNGMPGGVASDLSAAPALSENSYLPVGVQQGFNQQLDFGLHGNIHVFVGNSQGMGQVPWAANDPIFWMHHCNIDRIWVSWNAAAGHTNPNTAGWLNRSFVFANASGQAERAIVKDYTTTRKCNYRYDALLSTPSLVAAAPSPSASAAAVAPVALAKTTAPIALGAQPVRVQVQSTASPTAGAVPGGSPLAARVAALPENRRLYLVISNFKADVQPEALFRVYLDLPDSPPSDPINSHYVGSFNFFAAVPHGEAHADHVARTLSFDVTQVVANFDAKGLLKSEPSVTIAPSNEPVANAKPVIGEISFVEQ